MRMIQTLVLANSVHRPHSQISMRVLSLSLFHKFVEMRPCALQSTPHVVFWLKLVSVPGFKRVISLKNSLTTVCSWKKRFCCLPTQIREIWFHCLDIHSKLTQTLQLLTLQLKLLLSSAIQFIMNLQLWYIKRDFAPR